MPDHDWTVWLAVPFHTPSRRNFRPFAFRRPDGTTATCVGSDVALLMADGCHTPDEPAAYDALRDQLDGARKVGVPSGGRLDTLFGGDYRDFATVEVAELRRLVGPPADPPVTKTVPCEYCRGTGQVDCHSCGQPTDCDECDGSGKWEEQAESTDPRWLSLDGALYNSLALAPLLMRVPDGPVVCAVRRPTNNTQLLRLTGDGYRIVMISVTIGTEKPTGEIREATFTPKVPVPL